MPRNNFTLSLLLLLSAGSVYSQTKTQTELLRAAGTQRAAQDRAAIDRLHSLARQKDWPLTMEVRNGGLAVLVGVDVKGNPVYLSTDNNIRAAATIGTNRLWPGGSTGLNLSGNSNALKTKIALWDGGRVRPTHQEVTGRITNKNSSAISDHATHVAGTMMAKGINPLAKGMSFDLPELVAYDFTNHIAEMLSEAPNLLISNHSYGEISGWYYNESVSPARWEFRGAAGENEDYKFGYYSDDAQVWDSIAYNAPYYLIVKSSGNNRDVNGPTVGQPYYRYDAGNTMAPAGNRPNGISSNDGYDIISTYGTAKNILTVGAIDPIESGYAKATDVVMSEFSSWGPTDDGRIKPDVVANGVDVLSSVGTTDVAYSTFSGTSMATPNTSGSLVLLQEYYAKKNAGAYMRSATLKGLVIHTADEAGPANGPDYKFGWGLVSMEKAAAVITGNSLATPTHRIEELELNTTTTTITRTVVASGSGQLMATICWTDPKGNVTTTNLLDNPAIKLMNDLDIRIKKGATTYMPWTLNPASPDAAAVAGDNIRDNVERVEASDVVPGATYTIEITHKGTLARGKQAFSLIVSGIGGSVYCLSAPSSNQGSRIDSVAIGGIEKRNPAGCTTYTDYTSLTGNLEAGTNNIPLYVAVNSCDATNVTKHLKAWIDFNGDGTFSSAELVATSGVLNNSTPFNGTITIPNTVTVNNTTILRIVLSETNDPATIAACGNYTRGETQDYRVRFTAPNNDVGITSIVTPETGTCSNPAQYVTVRIKNFGSVDKSNITLSGTVKNGANTVLTLSGAFPGTIAAGNEAYFTFPGSYNKEAGITYTINCKTALSGDQLLGNDEKTVSVTVLAASATPTGEAEICNALVLFKPATNNNLNYWYDGPATTTPIAAGNTTSSNVITADKKYYLATNQVGWTAGAANRTSLGSTGSFNTYTNVFMLFKAGAPLTIESTRLYINAGNTSGKAEVILARNLAFNAAGTSYTYNRVSSAVIDIYPTDPAQGAVFYLNLQVPAAGDYGLIITQAAGQNATFFSNNGLTGNPYETGAGLGVKGVFQVTGNYRKLLTGNTDWMNFYYVFYDLKVRQANCASAGARTVVTAGVAPTPVITLANNQLSSSATSGNQWYLETNAISGATGQTYNPTIAGNYKVVVTDDFGCAMESNTIPYAVTSVPNVDPSEIGLKVYPNPSDGKFFTEFNMRTKADLSVIILSAVGEKVYQANYPGFVGNFNKTIYAHNLASGVYLLRIEHDNKIYLKKLVIK